MGIINIRRWWRHLCRSVAKRRCMDLSTRACMRFGITARWHSNRITFGSKRSLRQLRSTQLVLNALVIHVNNHATALAPNLLLPEVAAFVIGGRRRLRLARRKHRSRRQQYG